MKKFLLGTVGLVVLGMSAPASAADLAAGAYTKAPPPAVTTIDSWDGVYIGGNGGWGSSRKCWDFTMPTAVFVAAEGCHDATGGVAGGQIGYRWQIAAWVFGIEGQGDWADLRGSNVSLFAPAFINNTRIDAFGVLTGQVGYAWNNVLWYGKGGVAVTGDRYDSRTAVGNIVASNITNQTYWGGAVGTGLEFGFAPSWSVGVEYDHLFMQDKNVTFTNNGVAGPAGTLFKTDRIRQDVDLVTVRVNYRFFGPRGGGTFTY
jgi:outer membrane immunogenic protein